MSSCQGAEEEREELLYGLRSFGGWQPFLWTESIQVRTGPSLPEWDEMLDSWPFSSAAAADCGQPVLIQRSEESSWTAIRADLKQTTIQSIPTKPACRNP